MEMTFARCVGRCLTILLKGTVGPCFEACGQLFHHFNADAKTTKVFAQGKRSKVQFNDKVQTRNIPRNPVVDGSSGSRQGGGVPPGKATNAGPTKVPPTGKKGPGKGKVGPQGKKGAAEPEMNTKQEKGCVVM